jgi:CP family cyanate transporter-like MFS transporter
VPLLPAVGGHWRPALALWAIPAAAACLTWIPQFFRTAPHTGPPQAGPPQAGSSQANQAQEAAGAPAKAPEPSLRALLTDPVAIAVTAFMGVQCTGYYVTLTWLPTLLQDHGMNPHSAGWMLSYSALPGIAAGLGVAPVHATYLWMTLLGLGQGASISLALSYIAWRSPDARHTAHVSTMAQGFGYLLASLGPVAIGAIHAASGSWTAPLIVLAALLVPQLAAGVLACRERHVLAPREDTAPPADEGPAPWVGVRVWFTPPAERRYRGAESPGSARTEPRLLLPADSRNRARGLRGTSHGRARPFNRGETRRG